MACGMGIDLFRMIQAILNIYSQSNRISIFTRERRQGCEAGRDGVGVNVFNGRGAPRRGVSLLNQSSRDAFAEIRPQAHARRHAVL